MIKWKESHLIWGGRHRSVVKSLLSRQTREVVMLWPESGVEEILRSSYHGKLRCWSPRYIWVIQPASRYFPGNNSSPPVPIFSSMGVCSLKAKEVYVCERST